MSNIFISLSSAPDEDSVLNRQLAVLHHPYFPKMTFGFPREHLNAGISASAVAPAAVNLQRGRGLGLGRGARVAERSQEG